MKTTPIGILTIVAAVIGAVLSYLKGVPVNGEALATGILAGIGFIKAGDAPAQTPAP